MKPYRNSARLAALAALLMLPLASPVAAHTSDEGGVTGRLIELLVKKGVLPREDADALLKEARAEAPRAKKLAARPVPQRAAERGGAATPSESATASEPSGPNTVR